LIVEDVATIVIVSHHRRHLPLHFTPSWFCVSLRTRTFQRHQYRNKSRVLGIVL